MSCMRLFCIISLVIASLLPAAAAITPVNSYHLGDLDAGAAGGVTTAASADFIGTNALTCIGNPAYSTDVPPDYPLPDTFSLNFTGTNYGAAAGLTNVTDDFGIQAWVTVRSTGGNRAIAYNGDTGANGWGLYQVGDTFSGSFGGIAFIGSAPLTTNVWTHLALVRDSGVTTLYVNGVACGTNSVSPYAPDGLFALGCSPPALDADFFDGLVDEVQVFTFAAGTFSTNDLAYRSPDSRTLSAALNGTNFVINWPAARSDFQLQYTTNLAAGVWTAMSYSTNGNNQYAATDTPGDVQRCYRLVKPAYDTNAFVAIPGLAYIRQVVFTGATTTNAVPNLNRLSPGLTLTSASAEYTFDASQIVNPRTGTAEALNYHWVISYPGVPTYTDAGIHGYRRSRLHLDQFAMASDSDSSNPLTVVLTLSDMLNSNNSSNVRFTALVSDQALDLQMFSICQQPGAQACDTCPCTVAQALPPTDPNDPP
jgi:hypothetical protein